MFFINIFNRPYDRKVLSSLGLNVLNASRAGNKERCFINIEKIIHEIDEIHNGILDDQVSSYYELIFNKLIKHETILRGINVKRNDNKYVPEKLNRHFSNQIEDKYVLLQRLQMIRNYLATAGRFNHL